MADRVAAAGPLTAGEIDELTQLLAEAAQAVDRMLRGLARGPVYSRRIALAEVGRVSGTLETVTALLSGAP